jgi:hypothetical protein
MPSKKKKQKTKHGDPGHALSQAEIWDDSALIRSWNDALAEYDYYHSIHARGEDVEEVLRHAEMGELEEDEDDIQQAGGGWRPVDADEGAAVTVTGAGGGVNGATDPHVRAGDDEDEEGEVVEDDVTSDHPLQRLLDERRNAAIQQCKCLSLARETKTEEADQDPS